LQAAQQSDIAAGAQQGIETMGTAKKDADRQIAGKCPGCNDRGRPSEAIVEGLPGR
jgi:hypothetical protein